MRLHVLTLVAGCAASAAWGSDCSDIAVDAERLKCYDAKFPRSQTRAIPTDALSSNVAVPPTAQAPAPSPVDVRAGVTPEPAEAPLALPRFFKNVKLANETSPLGPLRTEPATFGYSKLNSDEYSTIQAALVWEPSESWFPDGSYFARYGWGPFVSGSINRNTLASKRADVRQVSAGLFGTLFRISAPKEPGAVISEVALGMLSKFEAAQRQNKVEETESVVYTWDNWITSKYLFAGIPYSRDIAWFVSPRIGLQAEDRRHVKAGNSPGMTKSVFGQLRVDLFPGTISNRVKLGVLAQRYVDLSAESGITERAETFSKISMEYLLAPARAPNTIIPSLSLERSYGADLLAGTPKQGLTQVVFKLKLN